MTRQAFLNYCLDTYGTAADYPFDGDFETAVFRHTDNRKWYAIVMRVSRRKFGCDRDEVVDVVNLKLPGKKARKQMKAEAEARRGAARTA